MSAVWLTRLSVFAFVGAASAQETTAPATPAAQQREEINEVVVTVQRREERATDVPLTLTVQSGEQLLQAGITDTTELNVAVPGVAMTRQGPYLQPAIRGIVGSIVGVGTDSPVAIYQDGIYVPGQDANFLELVDVERVEVLKGPQGTLFGRNATAGAIVVHTKEPSFEPTGKITVSDGYFMGNRIKDANELRTSAYFSGPISTDKAAFSVAGAYSKNQGYLRDIVRNKRTGEVESYLIKGKLLLTPTDNFKLLATAYYSDRDDLLHAGVSAHNGVTVAQFFPDAIIPGGPWQMATDLADGSPTGNQKSKGASLKAEWTFDGAGTFTSLTGYSKNHTFDLAEVDGAYSPQCVAVFSCVTPYEVDFGPTKATSQEFNFTSEQFGRVSFVAGAFGYYEDAFVANRVNPQLSPDGEIIGPAPFFVDAGVKTKAWALFSEVDWDVSDRLSVITGLRYSWEQKKGRGSLLGSPFFDIGGDPSWNSWTPRVSVRYAIDDNFNVYATYSRGFKSGALNTVALSQEVADPETLDSFEAGIKMATPRARLDLSGFYYNYKDLQQQFFQGVVTVIGNAANARLYGLEFDTTFEATDALQLRVAGSWVPHAEYKSFPTAIAFAEPLTAAGLSQVQVDLSGERMLRAPKFTGNVTATYGWSIGAGQVDGSLTAYYSSEYAFEAFRRVLSKNYVTLGAQVGFTPSDSKLRFSLWGKNLTNEAHVVGTTLSTQGDTVIYGDPRQIGVSVDYSF